MLCYGTEMVKTMNLCRILFILFAGVFGLSLVFITPPFQVPDEPAHFYRSYQISMGDLIAENHDGIVGHGMPKGLKDFENLAMQDMPFHHENKTTVKTLLNILNLPLSQNKIASELNHP